MGIFGSRKKVMVSSSVYNLAGDIQKRPNLMKAAVLSHVLSGSRKTTMSQSIQRALVTGPGLKQRSFGRWARTQGYNDHLRIVDAHLTGEHSVDPAVLTDFIAAKEGGTVQLQSVEVERGDFMYWAEQWMLRNYPDEFETEWAADYNDLEKKVYISRADDAGDYSLHIPEFFRDKMYLYTAYLDSDYKLKIWIYPQGGGSPELDAMFGVPQAAGEFFPPIPVRYDNKFLSETYKPDLYKLANKAFRKVTDKDLTQIRETLESNEDIKDIDHAFVAFGVSLNTPSQNGRRYIYEFFDAMFREYPAAAQNTIPAYSSGLFAVAERMGLLQQWMEEGQVGTAPTALSPPPVPRTSITLRSARTDFDYDMRIEWSAATRISGFGLIKPEAKPKTYWIESGLDIGLELNLGVRRGMKAAKNLNVVRLIHQMDESQWEGIEIVGLKHINKVYKGKAVTITSSEALEDTEESGFLVPIHEDILRGMPLVRANQLCTANMYLVLNCYKVVKKKWYQTGIFAVVLIIVMIVLAVVTYGGSTALTGTMGGLLATSMGLAAGTAMYIVVAMAANAIIGAILASIFTRAASAVFGEEIGAIVGAIASAMAMNVGNAMASGASMSQAFSQMMSSVNWLNITMSVGNSYAKHLNAQAAQVGVQIGEVQEAYKGAMEEILEKFQSLYSADGQANLNPLEILDSTNGPELGAESRDVFLFRTLMTGHDIAEVTMEMIEDFTHTTLDKTIYV